MYIIEHVVRIFSTTSTFFSNHAHVVSTRLLEKVSKDCITSSKSTRTYFIAIYSRNFSWWLNQVYTRRYDRKWCMLTSCAKEFNQECGPRPHAQTSIACDCPQPRFHVSSLRELLDLNEKVQTLSLITAFYFVNRWGAKMRAVLSGKIQPMSLESCKIIKSFIRELETQVLRFSNFYVHCKLMGVVCHVFPVVPPLGLHFRWTICW